MGCIQMGYEQVQWSVSCSDSWFLKLVREITASVISAVHSSQWQQRTGRKGDQRRNWLLG